MSEEYNVTLPKESLELIFLQMYQAMQLDYRQHLILTSEQQTEDAAAFLERQKKRFVIIVAIKETLAQEFPEGLAVRYTDVESIMLFARGLGNGERGGAETPTT